MAFVWKGRRRPLSRTPSGLGPSADRVVAAWGRRRIQAGSLRPLSLRPPRARSVNFSVGAHPLRVNLQTGDSHGWSSPSLVGRARSAQRPGPRGGSPSVGTGFPHISIAGLEHPGTEVAEFEPDARLQSDQRGLRHGAWSSEQPQVGACTANQHTRQGVSQPGQPEPPSPQGSQVCPIR